MKSGKAYQVECLTCRSAHLWRGHAPGEKAPSATTDRSPAGRRAGSAASGPARTTRVSAAARLEEQWSKATLGRPVGEFKAYNVGGTFHEGDLVRHKKFGDGVVTRVIDAKKVEVLFRDEPRTLAQGMS
jgi:hypothetical protein